MPRKYDYSRWDGTQTGFDLDADDIFAEITDDLLYHGDLNNALRRLMQQGFRDKNDERIAGIREMLEKLRRRRRDELERYDLGGVYDDIAQELREVMDMEREALDALQQEARSRATSAARRSPTRWPTSGACSSTCCRPTWPAGSRSCRSTSSRRRRRASGSRS